MDLLAHLEAFAAVAERRSFSAAAEQLHIAQPLLSRRIKNLERRLGGELFERSQRRVRITELGQLLLPHAQEVISRTRHLLAVAESAHRTTSLAVGVPPDCEPASLAQLIRIATQQGALISVHESPARDRAAALESGQLACALVRVPVDNAALTVPLGVAAVGAPTATRAVHLDSLRPRRADRAAPAPRLIVLPEDDIAVHIERLSRALAAVGLGAECIEVASSAATAVAEVLAGAGLLLCDERFARRHDLAWSPLSDRTLHRGYELATNTRPFGALNEPDRWLMPLLAEATGADQGKAATPAGPSAAERASDDRRRLAAGV
ncbi:MAG: LysR family transcriptional regulator [Solirubrobacteraceae bacterium]